MKYTDIRNVLKQLQLSLDGLKIDLKRIDLNEDFINDTISLYYREIEDYKYHKLSKNEKEEILNLIEKLYNESKFYYIKKCYRKLNKYVKNINSYDNLIDFANLCKELHLNILLLDSHIKSQMFSKYDFTDFDMDMRNYLEDFELFLIQIKSKKVSFCITNNLTVILHTIEL